MKKGEALTIQKLLSTATKIEKLLSDLGLNEEEKNRVAIYYFSLRSEIDGQLNPPRTIIGSPPVDYVPPKPTYEDLERSLESFEKKYYRAIDEVGRMKLYFRYQ